MKITKDKRPNSTWPWKIVNEEHTIIARFLDEADAKRFVASVGLTNQIARMTATGDTECNGEPLDTPWTHDPDDAAESMDSLIGLARNIVKAG